MKRFPPRVFGCLLALSLATPWLGPAAHARTPRPATKAASASQMALQKEARRQYQLGEGFFRAGRYPEALRAYKSGYELTNLPGFLINIAHCYTRVGDLERARGYYEEYLLKEPTPSGRRDQVLAALESLDARLSAARTGKGTRAATVRPAPRRPVVDPDEPAPTLVHPAMASPDQTADETRLQALPAPVTLANADGPLRLPLLPGPEAPADGLVVRSSPSPPPARTVVPTWVWVSAAATTVLAAGAAVYFATRSDRVMEGSIGTLGR